MIAMTCILLFFWSCFVIVFTYIAIERSMLKRFERRLFLPPYTAKLMTQTLLSDDDDKWKVFLETGIISYPRFE